MTAPVADLEALARRVRGLRRLRAADGERFAVAVDDVAEDLQRVARQLGPTSQPTSPRASPAHTPAPTDDPTATRRLRTLLGSYQRENARLRSLLDSAAGRPARRRRQYDDGRQLALDLAEHER